jgi:ribokinase
VVANSHKEIVVIGSANLDYVVRVASAPRPGQTVVAEGMDVLPGGKGANQAVAASQGGASVAFIGCVGADESALRIEEALRVNRVNTESLIFRPNSRTGIAIVSVTPDGENSIMVIPGANASLSVSEVEISIERLGFSDGIVVLQAETSPAIAEWAVTKFSGSGTRLIYNLAPFRTEPPSLLEACDPLVVNEIEAADLLGWPAIRPADLEIAAAALLSRCRSLVITLGPRGAYWADSGGAQLVSPDEKLVAVDTTGAGDAFVGALAAALSNGMGLRGAVVAAVHAAGRSILTVGGQSSPGADVFE